MRTPEQHHRLRGDPNDATAGPSHRRESNRGTTCGPGENVEDALGSGLEAAEAKAEAILKEARELKAQFRAAGRQQDGHIGRPALRHIRSTQADHLERLFQRSQEQRVELEREQRREQFRTRIIQSQLDGARDEHEALQEQLQRGQSKKRKFGCTIL